MRRNTASQESLVKRLFAGPVACAAIALCLGAGIAQAQTDASSSTAATPSSAPLQLQVPAQPLEAVAPNETSDNAVVDAQDSATGSDGKRGPQVHGSFTAGIGYSKGYGTSTLQAADLDISSESEGGNTYDVRIHVMQTKGLGFGPYGGYYGPRIHGD
jgi:hypothetical protein